MKTFLKNAVVFVFISVVVYVIFAVFDIYTFSRVDERTDADAAIVLGAGVWNNQPSPVFRERINHGIWLYKNGFAKHLIFTGGIGGKSNVSEASVAKDYAIQNNVPAEKIFIEELSTITLENIMYAKEIVDKNNFNKIIIVSDPLHMKRSISMAKDCGLNVYSSPTPTTKYVSWKTKIGFLFYEVFFYCAYIVYKYSPAIVLWLTVFGILLLIGCYRIFRYDCM